MGPVDEQPHVDLAQVPLGPDRSSYKDYSVHFPLAASQSILK